MDWIQQWQSKLNKQNGVAPLVRTGGSRHTGLAALPHRNIQNNHLKYFLFFLGYKTALLICETFPVVLHYGQPLQIDLPTS